MKKNVLIGLLAVVTVLTTGCGGGKKQKVQEDETPQKVLVSTQPAELMELEETAEFTSSIQGFVENNIAPSMPLRIEKIYVEVGQNVRRGQLLAQLDATQYDQLEISLAQNEVDYARYENVFNAGGMSQQQIDQMRLQIETQRSQMNNLLENIRLTSPIDGVVTARNYDAGDMYSGLPILQVMQINKLKVVLNVSEQYFSHVKTGMKADIEVDAIPGKTYEGNVSLIYPSVDPATRTFTVEVTIPNPKMELRPGMFSRTKLRFGTKQGVVVEDISVQKLIGSNEKYLFIVKDGVAQRRGITTGIQVGSKIEVLTGLSENEEVVVAGMSKLFDGSEVTTNPDEVGRN